jgi:four helix bundle protein
MTNNLNQQMLEKRLKQFSLRVLRLIKSLPKTEENITYGKQVIRSSSSIGANYAEATCVHT